MRTPGGRAVLPSTFIAGRFRARSRPASRACTVQDLWASALRCCQDSGQDSSAARTRREASREKPAFAWTARPWISEIMNDAASSLVMPGGSGAVATVSSNRSRSGAPRVRTGRGRSTGHAVVHRGGASGKLGAGAATSGGRYVGFGMIISEIINLSKL
jgi:hypothetical protein